MQQRLVRRAGDGGFWARLRCQARRLQLRQVFGQGCGVAQGSGVRIIHRQMDDRERAGSEHGARLLSRRRGVCENSRSDFVPKQDGVSRGLGAVCGARSGVEGLALCAPEVLLQAQIGLRGVVRSLGRDDAADVGQQPRLRRVEGRAEVGEFCGEVWGRLAQDLSQDGDGGRGREAIGAVDDDLGVGELVSFFGRWLRLRERKKTDESKRRRRQTADAIGFIFSRAFASPQARFFFSVSTSKHCRDIGSLNGVKENGEASPRGFEMGGRIGQTNIMPAMVFQLARHGGASKGIQLNILRNPLPFPILTCAAALPPPRANSTTNDEKMAKRMADYSAMNRKRKRNERGGGESFVFQGMSELSPGSSRE